MSIRNHLPSLNALLVLEAAARHGNFTAAAAELGVTQAAVSRQIALLEKQLGTPLFLRRHRAVEATPSCRQLASSLAIGFASIADSVDVVRSAERQEAVTIGATLAFSTLWLLPRISEFRKAYPSAQIRLVSQDERFHLASGEVDTLIRFGVPPFDDGLVVASRPDQVFPVCSPDYARALGDDPVRALTDASHELIGHVVPDRSWYSWSDWFARAGLATRHVESSLTFNQHTEALQAARSGQGIALGWGLLVQSFLDDGSLVRLSDAVVTAEGRYNLMIPVRRKTHPMRDVFVEWLASCLGP